MEMESPCLGGLLVLSFYMSSGKPLSNSCPIENAES